MIKTLFQSVDIYYFLMLVLCTLSVVVYGTFLCHEKYNKLLILDAKPIFKIDYIGLEFDRWSITHILFYLALGVFYPKTFYLSMIFGVIWEFIEFYVGYFKPKWFLDNWCKDRINVDSWWYCKWDDILMNCIGFLIGMNLAKYV
jgi:hypothetical protein